MTLLRNRTWQLTPAVLRLGVACSIVFGLTTSSGSSAWAASRDFPWPEIDLTPVVTGLSSPVYMIHAGDGSGRLFVVEQPGRIRIVRNGVLLPVPFLDITGRVRFGGEQGLLSVAFSPGYSGNGRFYVYYTNNGGDNVVSRFEVTGEPDIADPSSEDLLLTIGHPVFSNHNGGQLAFSPVDGYLYIGTGDGGGGGDQSNNAQNPASLLGKLLRIDVESGESPYGIPADNPYIATAGYLEEIWALGLRNPWRFAFDRATGDLYIGDVGQSTLEEVDYQSASSPGGENYGWRLLEGSDCFNPSVGCVAPDRYAPPVAEYTHALGCSITGGFLYRGLTYPLMEGVYFYGDYCTGRIWGLAHDGAAWQTAELLDSPYSISGFGEDEAGDLYLADFSGGTVYKITSQPSACFLSTVF